MLVRLVRMVALSTLLMTSTALADPLPSWRDGETKANILAFVDMVTDAGSEGFVPVADRIAVFDNDGTLWAEQPLYFQLLYALDRLKQRAAADPALLSSDALKAAAKGDIEALHAFGVAGLQEVLNVSHADLSVDAFTADVADWLATARHPATGLRFDAMVYQPMLELLSYLRDRGFTTYIVSGGGVHFMRVFAERVYGIPPNQVIGSRGETRYQLINGVPTIVKDAGIAFVDDKAGKPVAIDAIIGKRPILAGGNSDGDFEMLEWTTAAEGPRLALLVHHTDAERAFAYDRDSAVGRLVRGLDEGPARGWNIIDMARDWARIWPQQGTEKKESNP